MKIILTQNTTFYLDENGSDANDGRSPSTPWPIQTCWNNLKRGYELQGAVVTFQLQSSWFSHGCNCYGPIQGMEGYSSVVFNGDITDPGSRLVAPLVGPAFVSAWGSMFTLKNLDVDGHLSQCDCVSIGQAGAVAISSPGEKFYFRSASQSQSMVGNHVTVAQGGVLYINGNYKIRGGGQSHIMAGDGGIVYYNTNGQPGIISVDCTWQPVPSFFCAFMLAVDGGVINAGGIAYNGSALGPKFVAKNNGVINTGGSNPTIYFPGSTPGSVSAGGIYV